MGPPIGRRGPRPGRAALWGGGPHWPPLLRVLLRPKPKPWELRRIDSRLSAGRKTPREKSSPAGRNPSGNSLPEGEIDAIAIAIELDIISIDITIISIIYTVISTAASRHRYACKGYNHNESFIETACQHLLLLVGFDTLIYRKYYDTPPILVGHQMAADIFDEYLRMGESTCLESMYRFCRAVIAVFEEYYCREPNVEDTRRLLSINESRGFPGMIGSIDCMHWEWKNCPFGWQDMYSGHDEGRTVILEAVISQDLWIWHSFFGMAGFNNDINVLHRSPVFERLMQGKAPRVSYEINGNAYEKPYYLADGIYPDWATLVNTVRTPNFEKTRRFAKMQEACRKDVERGFGVLQARWAILRHPARTWLLKTMHEVMTCCVIVHNMIVENERPDGRNENHWEFQGELVAPVPGALSWTDYLHMNVEVTNDTVSKQLQTDLIEHQWTLAGDEDHA
ncbi:hypothetical protein QYE76_014663 [Lolium multiflorum]|uniref:Uncharacterized protein n=1 Tax=Lolium multiflorum TaxID=4521 RepID=A0AAD8X613_LOLMU|nr:hypothetical protein QYE76_014663 [Lolium multiflorum]